MSFCALIPLRPCSRNLWGVRIHGVLSASNPSLNSRPGHFLWRAWSAIGNPETSQKGREYSRNMHASCKIVKWEQISDGRYSHKLWFVSCFACEILWYIVLQYVEPRNWENSKMIEMIILQYYMDRGVLLLLFFHFITTLRIFRTLQTFSSLSPPTSLATTSHNSDNSHQCH